MLSYVTANDVTFELANGRLLFSKLNFSIKARITALVGPNGIGKSCLAQVLAQHLEPTSGIVRRHQPVTLFPQRQIPPTITVEEFLGPDHPWSLLSEQLLQHIDQKSICAQLSGGQWMRVRLAKVVQEGFLILDEPTNDLDREGRETLMEFLKKTKNGVLLISHDRECLQMCDEVLELSIQGLKKITGSWSEYETDRQQERERLATNLERAKNFRDETLEKRTVLQTQQEKRNRRGAESAARGGLPKILLGARKRRAQVTTGLIDAATLQKAQASVQEAHEAYAALKVDPIIYANLVGQEIPSQKLVAEARDFNVMFKDWVFKKDLNFSWRGNIRLALKGSNGSGKSTLLQSILGAEFKTRGEIRNGYLQTLYLDQRCSLLDDSKSVFENIREVCRLNESEIRNNLAKFLFFKDSVFQKVKQLSGGERLRAALAKGLLSQEKPELLILDEPTNNLDLPNIEFLEHLLREFRGALILISHDQVFLENCLIKEELQL